MQPNTVNLHNPGGELKKLGGSFERGLESERKKEDKKLK